MKILQQIVQTPEFKANMLKWGLLKGESVKTFDRDEGTAEAFINEVSFSGDICWGKEEGNLLEWTIDFSVESDVSFQYSTSDGEEKIEQLSGLCMGTVILEFSDDLLTLETIEQIIQKLSMEIKLQSYPGKE